MSRFTLCCAAVIGFVLLTQQGTRLGFPATATEWPIAEPAKPLGGKLKELLKERLATVREMTEQVAKLVKDGSLSPSALHQATIEVLKAELDLCESKEERIAVLEKTVAAAKEHEAYFADAIKLGVIPARGGWKHD